VSDPDDARARLETIELKIAHLERTVQELSDVLYRQQRELDALDAQHRRLLERVESAAAESADAADAATRIEIPPHY
jgi:SlyX protein